jgi:hypothetical protein
MGGQAACLFTRLHPRYVDVAVLRWQALTGKAAVLAGEECVFGDIAAARELQNAAVP